MKKYFFLLIALISMKTGLSQTYTFTGNGYWSNSNNWASNTIPPSILPSGSTINIACAPGDSCVLDVSQTILQGATLIIATGANFIVSGNLTNGSIQLSSVVICNQEWTNKNLDVTAYRNGDIIPQVTNKAQWDTIKTGAWCYYNFSPTNTIGNEYGKYYNWYAVNDPRGLAPFGWHIPCDSEWTLLSNCLGGKAIAGAAMKEVGTQHFQSPSTTFISPNTGATNSSGFTAIGSGSYFSADGANNTWDRIYYTTKGYIPYTSYLTDCAMWASTEINIDKAAFWEVYVGFDNLYNSSDYTQLSKNKNFALSVRCVKGEINTICNFGTPILSTDNVSIIGYNYAKASGNIIAANNDRSISERGFVWSTTSSPTISNNKIISGSGKGYFTDSLTGLSANTTYYLRAYAVNSVGLSYGNQVSFTTGNPILPTVKTWFISNDNSTATSGGNITNDGGKPVLAKGIVWGTSPSPTLASNFINAGTGITKYTSNISGLIANTTYYIRAYATTIVGTAYGNEIIINTSVAIPPSAIICDKVWMQKNMDISTYRNGDPIQHVTDSATWGNLTTGAWCWYNNDSASYAATYGKLYNWYAVTDPRGFAPLGWHVPEINELLSIFNCVGGSSAAKSDAVREEGTTHWTTNPGANNSTGFTALPSGSLYGKFNGIGVQGRWWSATPTTYEGIIYPYTVEIDLGNVFYLNFNANNGFSVRCIRD